MSWVVEREHALPVNPNCVSFAARAAEVLPGRSWAEVLRLGARAVEPFHRACGLPVLVGFSWRVALDRKNHRFTQLTAYFVFDGPATAAHLDTLEAAVAAAHPAFSHGSIERVPATGASALLACDGVVHGLWGRDVAGGEPWLRKLDWQDGRIQPRIVPASEATAAEVVEELPQVIGVPARYGDADRESERMRLAFARHFAQRIVEADGVVQEAEAEFMANVFPPDLRVRLGLQDPALEAEYLEAARERLPHQLGHHDKLGLVGLFFSACYSDGSLDAREMKVIKDAGEVLGLSREEVVKYLRRFW